MKGFRPILETKNWNSVQICCRVSSLQLMSRAISAHWPLKVHRLPAALVSVDEDAPPAGISPRLWFFRRYESPTSTYYIFSSTCPACITGRLPYAAKLGLHAIYTDFYIRFYRSVACLVNEIHFLAWGSSLSQLSWPNVGIVARLTDLQYLLFKHYPKSLLLCNPSITSLISDTPLP